MERKVGIRVDFAKGADNLGPSLDRYKTQLTDLSRLTTAWQREMQNVPAMPVGPWMKAQEALKEQGLRSTFGLGIRQEGFNARPLDPMMAALTEGTKPRMNMAALATRPPELTGELLKQSRAADQFRQSIDELEKSLRKQIATQGMSANQAKVWELEQKGATRSQVERLMGLQEQADVARRKRNLGGAGFVAAGLLMTAMPDAGLLQQGVGGAMAGAGIASSLGGIAGSPAGIIVGAAVGGLAGMLKDGIENVLPTAAQFNATMQVMANSIGTSERALDRVARGETPGAGEFDLLSGATRARIAAARARGGEPAALEELRRERERFARMPSFGEEGTGAFPILRRVRAGGPRDTMGESFETSRLADERRHEARLAWMDEILRRGGAEGLTRPEIPAARGSGGIESIGIEITRAILERGGPAERTAMAAEATAGATARIGDWLREAFPSAGAPAPAMP